MKITILYDNNKTRRDLESDHGFSCLVSAYGKNLLFDTGADGSILLSNMKLLGIDPLSVDTVFISHPHFDHIGGLAGFLHENKNVDVWVPFSFRGVRRAKKIVQVKGPVELDDNFFSTGELEGIEQSLVIKTQNSIVLIVGCSHPDMEIIFKAASQFGKIYAIVGGLHGFNRFELFKDLSFICPTHCTQHKEQIIKMYPEKFLGGGVGSIIEL